MRVDVPDSVGREAILKVHTRKMKLEDPTVLKEVAEITPGETRTRGEDLEIHTYEIDEVIFTSPWGFLMRIRRIFIDCDYALMKRNQLLKGVSGATLGASLVLSSYVSSFSLLCT